MNVYVKEKQIHRQNQWFPVGKGVRDTTTMYKTAKQQEYIVQHRELKPL